MRPQGDCTNNDPYFDYDGTLRCLMEGAGELQRMPTVGRLLPLRLLPLQPLRMGRCGL